MKHFFKRNKHIIWIVLVVFIGIYIFRYIDKNIKPTLVAISEIKAKAIANQVINDSVNLKINDDIDYKDLIFVRYDDNGRVTLMQANTIIMNDISSEVASEVQKQLEKVSESEVDVPLRNAFDTQLLKLPSINMKMVPEGTVYVDFATEFQESGINQTRHRIYLIVEANIKIIVPLVSEEVKISTNVPIAETIIIGDVPDQYINVPRDEVLRVVK
ncbi:sporulation protein YunB [Anaerosalibacter bizertensis]|uniref:Sporulation protein YunB n=1 Tax=Anaerosalibacter bizertensis TaxID=932217 RepID=A0A844FGS6_9FIRM|nr:sporulation protein YunB [Anaerosalibacter bizertensis]MBV1817906.1 sporulation protein YunB [Bacteroidales bacterium MSK.15.36]MBU5293865.1 sporulation protein YunB [Anaerosalibacter bizertensis]MCB5559475.1 sporulation protein YunB [Anaerosalibacter bizertensis]MCG4564733.1 sporulation protein YunB [Anaerosalibacter bizertensis]MCG4583412.1 sporulation protein YunB [Anaerosalibacter bizertensis]